MLLDTQAPANDLHESARVKACKTETKIGMGACQMANGANSSFLELTYQERDRRGVEGHHCLLLQKFSYQTLSLEAHRYLMINAWEAAVHVVGKHIC